MSEYVDIDFILNETDEFAYENGVLYGLSGNSSPTIDIVLCQDCKHYEDPDHKIFENCVKWKESHGIILPIKPNDSCSYGERVDEYQKEYRELGLGKLNALRRAEGSRR